MLYVLRHGRTAANASGRLLGRLDVPLDEVGEAQATALAAAVGPVDRIVASPLTRTRQTAAALATVSGVEVEIDDRWLELDYGDLDGVPLADVPAATWAAWRADTAFCPPGGESLADLGVRVREALDDLAADAASRTVAVVSHVSPIKAAVAWALGVDDAATWRLFVSPASVTRIAVQGRGPVLTGFNDVAHLDPSDTAGHGRVARSS